VASSDAERHDPTRCAAELGFRTSLFRDLEYGVPDVSYPQQIEVHVFYVAMGYFISYLPCADLASAVLPGYA
jgi:hypothetical protein